MLKQIFENYLKVLESVIRNSGNRNTKKRE